MFVWGKWEEYEGDAQGWSLMDMEGWAVGCVDLAFDVMGWTRWHKGSVDESMMTDFDDYMKERGSGRKRQGMKTSRCIQNRL